MLVRPRWYAARVWTMVWALACAAMLLTACGDGGAPAEQPPSAPADPVVVNADITVHRLEYATRGPADPLQNWADFYLPAGPQRRDSIPLVVLIHGGSWKAQWGAGTMRSYAMDLARRGMAVYNVEYRRVGSGGGWPTTFTDVADALDYVVQVDERFPQITVDDELVVGHSAGAQLAAWASTRNTLRPNEIGSEPKFRPTRVVALAGPLDMTYAATHGNDRIVTVLGGTPTQVPQRYRSVDPIQNIDPTMPVIAIHGDRDTVVPLSQSQRYISAVDRRGGIGALIIAKGEDHVSIVDARSRAYRHILDVITDASHRSVRQLAADYRG